MYIDQLNEGLKLLELWALLELRVLFEGGSYMTKYGMCWKDKGLELS